MSFASLQRLTQLTLAQQRPMFLLELLAAEAHGSVDRNSVPRRILAESPARARALRVIPLCAQLPCISFLYSATVYPTSPPVHDIQPHQYWKNIEHSVAQGGLGRRLCRGGCRYMHGTWIWDHGASLTDAEQRFVRRILGNFTLTFPPTHPYIRPIGPSHRAGMYHMLSV